MDLEETVKELKADLKNARELITCLTETMRSQRTGRDEDLHRKLDEILKGKENQIELEKKVEALREEVMAISQNVTLSNEIGRILDTVQTTEGYAELFVNDFQRIQGKQMEIQNQVNQISMEVRQRTNFNNSQVCEIPEQIKDLIAKQMAEIKKDIEKKFQLHSERSIQTEKKLEKMESEFGNKFDEMKQMMERGFQLGSSQGSKAEVFLVENMKETTNRVKSEFEKYWKKLEDQENRFDQKLEPIKRYMVHEFQLNFNATTQLEAKIMNAVEQVKELHKNVKISTANVANIGEEQKRGLEKTTNLNEAKVEVKKVKPGIALKPKTKVGNKESEFKCRNCLLNLPNDLPKQKDGVSVKCPAPKCSCINVMRRLKEGHKWMKGNCGHLCEFPLNTVELVDIKCPTCGQYAKFVNQKDRMALICS